MLEKLESSIKDLEKDLGDTTRLEKLDAERGLLDEEEDEDVEGGIEAELGRGISVPQRIQSQMETIKAQLRQIQIDPHFLDNLSEEERLNIKNELLEGIFDSNKTSGTWFS